jgi:hypothetical protein
MIYNIIDVLSFLELYDLQRYIYTAKWGKEYKYFLKAKEKFIIKKYEKFILDLIPYNISKYPLINIYNKRFNEVNIRELKSKINIGYKIKENKIEPFIVIKYKKYEDRINGKKINTKNGNILFIYSVIPKEWKIFSPTDSEFNMVNNVYNDNILINNYFFNLVYDLLRGICVTHHCYESSKQFILCRFETRIISQRKNIFYQFL